MQVSIGLLCVFMIMTVASPAQPKVSVAGSMKQIMHHADLSTHVNIDTLDSKHLYGLGPVSGLKGEIIVLDGKVFSTSVVDAKPVNGSNTEAAMLVYSHVSDWTHTAIPVPVSSIEELETTLKKLASDMGFSSSEVFPFRLTGMATAKYHIMDWREGHTHTAENHHRFAWNDSVVNENVTLLGFYSDHHEGIFTRHHSTVHIHILTERNQAGHLDRLDALKDITIYLPGKKDQDAVK